MKESDQVGLLRGQHLLLRSEKKFGERNIEHAAYRLEIADFWSAPPAVPAVNGVLRKLGLLCQFADRQSFFFTQLIDSL